MYEELYVSERVINWLQFEMIARMSHMRVKIRQMVIDRKGTTVPYIDFFDFIRLEKKDDHYITHDYFPMKCSEKLEKRMLEFVDSNPPETRPDGKDWIESYDEDDEPTGGDPEYKYYHLANVTIFNDTYIHWQWISEHQWEFFGIFFKEDMVELSNGEYKSWSVKVPLTPKEIQRERTRQVGWRK